MGGVENQCGNRQSRCHQREHPGTGFFPQLVALLSVIFLLLPINAITSYRVWEQRLRGLRDIGSLFGFKVAVARLPATRQSRTSEPKSPPALGHIE